MKKHPSAFRGCSIHDIIKRLIAVRRADGFVYTARPRDILRQIEDGEWPKWEEDEHSLIDRIDRLLAAYELGESLLLKSLQNA